MPEDSGHPWAGETVENVDDEDAQNQSPVQTRQAAPRRVLSVVDTVALIVGVVVGAGIFKTPAMVATHAGGAELFLLAWVVGGVISLIGALCYAELATAYPNTGGDYHYPETRLRPRHGFSVRLGPHDGVANRLHCHARLRVRRLCPATAADRARRSCASMRHWPSRL